MKHWTKGMRDAFFNALFKIAKNNKDILLLTADTGAICHDKFRKELTNQYINAGIAEQNLIGVASGLAMSGKIVYVYGIIPFVTMRCYEQIRVDICLMNLPVNIIGIGAGLDYSTLGSTHHGTEDLAIMRVLPNMTIYNPADNTSAELLAKTSYKSPGPKYIRLDRTGAPLIYKDQKEIHLKKGFTSLKNGKDLCIISTGRMVFTALEAANNLKEHSIDAKLIDLFKIRPINKESLMQSIGNVKYIVTLEEHFLFGGIGEIVSSIVSSSKNNYNLKTIGIENEFCSIYGSREHLHKFNKIDVKSITSDIINWIKNK